MPVELMASVPVALTFSPKLSVQWSLVISSVVELVQRSVDLSKPGYPEGDPNPLNTMVPEPSSVHSVGLVCVAVSDADHVPDPKPDAK
jgi:hypothetical protein